MSQVIAFERLREVVAEAGALVRCAAGRARVIDQHASSQEDLHPTTDLDRETDDLLYRRLFDAFEKPEEVAYLTEERADDPVRLEKEYVLIVDPIDGTRSVLRGLPEATVAVGLWHHGHMVWACVLNPFTGEEFVAERGRGAWCNGQRIRVSQTSSLSCADLVMSRTENETGRLAWLEGRVRYRPVGSIAYKMCLVAAGRADGSFTPGVRHEWDIAASTLIVEEAGGRVTNGSGESIRFNGWDLRVPGLVVSNGILHEELIALLRESPWRGSER